MSVDLGQGGQFDLVAEFRGGAMGLDEADVVGLEASELEGFLDHRRLALGAGGDQAHPVGAVVVERAAEQQRPRSRPGLPGPAQHDHAGAAGGHGATATLGEGAAPSVGRQDVAFAVRVSLAHGQLDGDAAGEGDIALEGKQAADGGVNGDEEVEQAVCTVRAGPVRPRRKAREVARKSLSLPREICCRPAARLRTGSAPTYRWR